MASGMATMQVQVPAGAKPGQTVQARTPDGLTVQAVIPPGMKPGKTFAVQYPTGAGAPNLSSQGDNSHSRMRKRDVLAVFGLVALAVWLTTGIGNAVHKASELATQFLVSHGIIILGACLAVAYDWNTLGPSVALQHGAIAGVVAWLLVVPLSQFIGSVSVLAVFTISIVCWLAASVAFGPPGCCFGLLFVILAFSLSSFFADLLRGPVGEILIFAAVFFVVRVFAGGATMLQKVAQWPYLTEIHPSDPDYSLQCDFFLASCTAWEHKFPFSLKVQRIYRVDRPRERLSNERCGEAGVRQLFHGTGWESAKAVCCDGFRLPATAGMFGKGLYFADCPLKCWRYCFPSKQASELIPRTTGRGGLIFMCWVELGEVREEKEARKDLGAYDRKGWKAWMSGGKGAYDSVKGVDETEGGSVRVPEYVVYRTEQAHLAYMFEVVTCAKGGE